MGTGVKPMGRGDKNGFNQSLRRRPICGGGSGGVFLGGCPGGVRMVFLGVPGRRCRLVLGRDFGRCRCWTFHKLFHLRQQVVPDGCRMWAVRMRTELARRQRVCEAGTATTQSNVHLRLQESCSGRIVSTTSRHAPGRRRCLSLRRPVQGAPPYRTVPCRIGTIVELDVPSCERRPCPVLARHLVSGRRPDPEGSPGGSSWDGRGPIATSVRSCWTTSCRVLKDRKRQGASFARSIGWCVIVC